MSSKPGSEKKAGEASIALAMLDNMDMAFLAIDEKSRVTYANRTAGEFFGQPGGTIAGTSLHDLLEACLQHTGIFDKFYDRVLTTGKTGELEVPVQHSRWARFRLFPVEGGMNVMAEDVTQRHIREEPQKTALLAFNRLPEAVFLMYGNGSIYYANDAACKTTGYTREELKALRASNVIPDLDPELLWPDGGHATGSARFMSVLRSKSGDAVPVEVSVSGHTMFGKINYIVSVRDIAGSKLAEDSLRESREKFRMLFDSMDVAIQLCELVWDDDGRPVDNIILDANPAYEKHAGLRREQVVGRRIKDVLSLVEQVWLDRYGEVVRTGKTMHFEEYNAALGHWFDVYASPMTGNRFAAVFTDITERKRAEEALRESETGVKVAEAVKVEQQRLYNVLETIPAMVCLITPDYHIPFANRSFREKFGESRGRHCFEYCYGHSEPCEFCESLIPLKTGKPHHWEISTSDGSVIEAHDYPFTDIDGSPMVLEMDIDITKHRQTEEELEKSRKYLEELVRQRTGNLEEAKDQAELYLDLMSHDINNMHQIALGYLEMLRGSQAWEGEPAEYLDTSIDVLQRGAELIKNVRKLQKLHKETLQTMPVDVCELLPGLLGEFGAVPGKTITFNLNGHTHCYVEANELLREIYANLVSNAIKHTGERASINVDIDVVTMDGRRYCRAIVEDDGPGIPDVFKDRIFHRMSQGTANGKGMGLGLYIVLSLVENYGGRVWIEDRVQGNHTKGARFVVMLPAIGN